MTRTPEEPPSDRLPRLVPGTSLVSFPARRQVGRLGGVRREGLARAGQTPVPPGAYHLFQLRGRMRAAGLCRQGQRRREAVRRESRASGVEGSQLREGPGDTQPDVRPGANPPPDAKGRAARGGQVGDRSPGRRHSEDIASRIRRALVEDRHDEIMYHVGRPGEDGFIDRILRSWGVDGHNSHTNICSAGARTGYAMWMGYDRPSRGFRQCQVHPVAVGPTRVRSLLQPPTHSGSSRLAGGEGR